MKMNRSGKCESEILLIFFFSVANPRTYAVGSELLNLGKVLLRGIIFYIVCAGVSDIDRCRSGWIGNLV